MKSFAACWLIAYSISAWASSVFLQPIADFSQQKVELRFIADIDAPLEVENCSIYRMKEKWLDLKIQIQLKPGQESKKVIDFPKEIHQVSDLVGTHLQCWPGSFRVSTWTIKGWNW